MSQWLVVREGSELLPSGAESNADVVDADGVTIEDGVLLFYEHGPAVEGFSGGVAHVMAYADGTWMKVARLDRVGSTPSEDPS